MIVSKRVSFDAAHHLPYYQGKCRNPHGHHWEVEVGIKGVVDPETDMVVDFSWLKGALDEEVVGRFDHTNLNDIFTNPTAEVLARHIFFRVMLHWIQGPEERIRVEYVRVWETRNSMAEFNKEDWEARESK